MIGSARALGTMNHQDFGIFSLAFTLQVAEKGAGLEADRRGNDYRKSATGHKSPQMRLRTRAGLSPKKIESKWPDLPAWRSFAAVQ